MPPSRRALLRSLAVAVPVVAAGCTTRGLNSDPNTSTTTETTSQDDNQKASFEVRLEGSDTDQLLVNKSDVNSVAEVDQGQTGGYLLPVELSEDATEEFSDTIRRANVAESPDQYEIVLYSDGSEINRLGVSPEFAQNIGDGDWDGEFVLRFEDREEAVKIRESLTNN